jgi:hypothetical protein
MTLLTVGSASLLAHVTLPSRLALGLGTRSVYQ